MTLIIMSITYKWRILHFKGGSYVFIFETIRALSSLWFIHDQFDLLQKKSILKKSNFLVTPEYQKVPSKNVAILAHGHRRSQVKE